MNSNILIQKAATALHQALAGECAKNGGTAARMPDDLILVSTTIDPDVVVRALLKAIATPTDAMTSAGAASLDYDEDGGLLGSADEAAFNMWREMIRVAGL